MKTLSCKSAWKDVETGESAVQQFVFIFIRVNEDTDYLNLLFPLLNFSGHVCSANTSLKEIRPSKRPVSFPGPMAYNWEPEDIYLGLTLESLHPLEQGSCIQGASWGCLPGRSRMAVACLCLCLALCLVRPAAGSQNEMVIDTGLVCLWSLVPFSRDSAGKVVSVLVRVCYRSHDIAQGKRTLNYLKAVMCDLT